MFVIIIHGDNIAASRQKLTHVIAEAKEKGSVIVHLDAKTLTRATLESAVSAQSLFSQPTLVVIEGLFSLPVSKKRSELIAFVGAADVSVVLWDKKEVTKTQLKNFPSAQSLVFKSSSFLFKWLENVSSQPSSLELFHQACEHDGAEMCFVMLQRQLRLLIQAKENHPIVGPPFVVNKLKQQAARFTLPQLLQLHRRFLELDWQQKTSQSRLSLQQNLDLLLLSLFEKSFS